jgi:hypothetical protein
MNNINEFLQRASDQCGFRRNGYVEKNMPTNFHNLMVVPFFGDMQSTFVLSSFLLNQFKEAKKNKYLIVCSWPNQEDFYPYADEYWEIEDHAHLTNLAIHAKHMNNTSDVAAQYTRSLLSRFEDVLLSDGIKEYYNHGFQQKYWDLFGDLKLFRPSVPSATKGDNYFAGQVAAAEQKVVVFPSVRIRAWEKGQVVFAKPLRDFWVHLVNCLIEEGITPVIYQNDFTYDLSTDFLDKCIYLKSKNISDVLASMRSVGCVLDLYSGVSRLAIAARCPFVCVDERTRFMEDRDYEIDDLCCQKIPKQYIFSFPNFLLAGDSNYWGTSITDAIISKLRDFLPKLDRDSWESTTESNELISYDLVRKRKIKRLGAKFIRKY